MKQFISLIFLMLSSICFGQTITLDLAENKNSSFTQTIDPQTLNQIIIKNKIVIDNIGGTDVKYQIDVKREHIENSAIPTSSFLAGGGGSTCTSLNTAIHNLNTSTDESNIPNLVREVEKEIKNVGVGCVSNVTEGKRLINLTKQIFTLPNSISIGSGDQITIVVTRIDNNVNPTKWTYIFKTEKISHGKIFYGFSYLFSNTLTSFPTYFSKKDTGNSYLITRSNSSNKGVLNNISPTFMYSHLFFKNPDAHFKFGLTGGFMLDLSNPSAVFSPSVIIGDNFSLNLGLAFTRKDQLKGQYSENQRITENLDFDQLHNKIWTYDMFFSIAFHFDKNPFKKEETSK